MAVSSFSSNRTFRVWLYTVSHATLLLRSVKDGRHATRVDVLFKPVRFMNLPTTLEGLEVRVASPADFERAVPGASAILEEDADVFAVSSRGFSGWVVGGVMASHEDTGSDFDASHFSVPRMVW